jgi:hypothetical protein
MRSGEKRAALLYPKERMQLEISRVMSRVGVGVGAQLLRLSFFHMRPLVCN